MWPWFDSGLNSPVTKRVKEWVLNKPIKLSQSTLGSFGWTKTMMAAETSTMTVLASQTIHACFAVAFRAQASSRFICSHLCHERFSPRYFRFPLSSKTKLRSGEKLKQLKKTSESGFDQHSVHKRPQGGGRSGACAGG